jgi:hypothetical protein
MRYRETVFGLGVLVLAGISLAVNDLKTCEFYSFKRNTIACQTKLREELEISKIMAVSSVAIQCANAPVLLLSDGSRNILFTLSPGKDHWSNRSDPTTGIGTAFPKKAILALSLADEGVCVEPPQHLHVSFVLATPKRLSN